MKGGLTLHRYDWIEPCRSNASSTFRFPLSPSSHHLAMSLKSKIFFGASCVAGVGTVFMVHYLQIAEREVHILSLPPRLLADPLFLRQCSRESCETTSD